MTTGLVSVKLNQVGRFMNGANFGPKQLGHGTKFVNLDDIYREKDLKSSDHYEKVSIKNEENYLLEDGDILFVRSSVKPSGVGYPCLFIKDSSDRVVFCGFIIRYRFDHNIVFPKYLIYQLLLPLNRNKVIARGQVVANTNINQRGIGSLFINIHSSLPEQKAIAGILSKVDEAIESVEKNIKAADRLKKSLMQNLLTGKLKPDGIWRSEDEFYLDEKFGKVPKGWEVKRLKEVFDINSETLPSKTDPNFKFRYITIEAVNTEIIDYDNCPEYYFKESPGRARRIIKSGDILISGVRPNLKAFAIYEPPNSENWICSTGFFVLSRKENENNKFHFYQILSSFVESQFHSYVAGTNYPAIGDRDIRNIRLLRPSYEEQNKISEQIDSIANIISKKKSKIYNLKALKRSLMQNLLTGKVRVDVEKINKQLEEV